MYAYSQDKKHLVFQDAFGQTRVIFGKKPRAKTDKKERASHRGGFVSMSDAGDMVLTFRDQWDKTTLWSLPDMKPIERFDRFEKKEATLHPDGTHLLFLDRSSSSIVFESYPGGGRSEVAIGDPGDVDFPKDVWLNTPVELMIGPGGSFAAVCKGVIVDGFISGSSVQVVNRKALALEGEVQLFATADGAAIVAHMAGVSRVHTPGGGDYSLETVCPAQVGGGHVAWQPDVGTIARRPLEGGDEERFALEGDDAGYAMLFPGEGALCVLPWHREDMLDLLAGQRVSRKLKAAEVEIRRAFVEYMHPFLLATQDGPATLEWSEVDIQPRHESVSWHARVSMLPSARGVFFRDLKSSAGGQAFGGYRSSSYGFSGSY